MRLFRRFVVACCIAGICGPGAAKYAHGDARTYQVGVAKVDITPEYPIRLNGFGSRRTESEGISQRIWARALAIGEEDGEPFLLITLDSLGIRMSMVDEVAKRIHENEGIARERIAVTFTHSHTTPKVNGACDTIFSSPIPPAHQERIDRYTAELTDAIEKVALAALADRAPARLEWSVGKVDFARNRRTEGGPIDHDLPMLVVMSVDGDQIRAIYVTYACHCVTLSHNQISGDWAGYAAEAMERMHPGAVALVSIGCGSDSNPSSGVTGDNLAAAAEQGAEIGAEVQRLLARPLRAISGPITATLRKIELPLAKLPTQEELTTLAGQDSPAGYNARVQLARLEEGGFLQRAIDYPIQTVSFGDSLAMVFLAGEVCVDYSLRLKSELDASRVWIHGYSNDFCSYIPSERLLKEGGYGGGAESVYFALPSVLRGGLEDKIIAEVHSQVPRNFRRGVEGARRKSLRPTDAANSVAAIRTHGDLMVELVASEPLIADPVAIDFGADGRLWVAEMSDYTRGVDEEFAQSGSIKTLVDRDGDGRFDASAVFVSGLRFPTDVKVWRGGVIVCDAPDVIYFEDTDGDGAADLRRVLLTGFATHNAQARVNSLRWGLDNWIHGSCGLFGGTIRSFNGQTLELGARDFRFEPDTGQIEAVSGKTQQGRTRDDWGNWFGCENGALCDHYPLTEAYLARNPHVIPPAPEISIPVGSDPSRLFPIGTPVLFELSGAPGRPTSACGLEIYRDTLLGPRFQGNAFVAEPVNQLVHRRVLSPRGISFAGARAAEEAEREFLASPDNWFRPVQIRTGPDGCLWVVDMCRYVIEHPRFIPEDALSRLDTMAGNKEGRIYRVRPREGGPRPILKLNDLAPAELAMALDSPNGPQRDLAHELLIQREATEAEVVLEKLVKSNKRPETRLQALCAIDGLGVLSEAILLHALSDDDARVRRHAIRLSEGLLPESEALAAKVVSMIEEKDPQIQLQLAYTLGEWDDPRAAVCLARTVDRADDDPYLTAAALSSIHPSNSPVVARHLLKVLKETGSSPAIDTALVMLAVHFDDGRVRRDIAQALLPGTGAPIDAGRLETLAKIIESIDPAGRQRLDERLAQARNEQTLLRSMQDVLSNPAAEEGVRLSALRTLIAVNADLEPLREQLDELLGPQNSPTVQSAAIMAASRLDPPGAVELLLANWRSYSPAARAQALDAIFSRDDCLRLLCKHIADGTVSASQLDALQRQRLTTHADARIRAAANSAFEGAANEDRRSIVDSFAELPPSSGIATGRQVFRKHCESCHRLEEQGYPVGPDLAALTSRTRIGLLESIFDPNRAVDERYQCYTALTEDGRTYTGILLRETANSITLLEQGDKEHTLLRSSIDELRNTEASLMPEGFERDLSPADVSSLLEYLSAQGRPPKTVAGNQPKAIAPREDGSLWLLATDCEIHGEAITFEAPFENIGYWHGAEDHIAWNLHVPESSNYELIAEWACAGEHAGNSAIVDGFATPLEWVVPSTGGWHAYQRQSIGHAELDAGPHRIIVRPAGIRNGTSLMDLKALFLVAVLTDSDEASEKPSRLPPQQDASAGITKLLDGLAVGTPAEYDRIPQIFQLAIAAGKRNDAPELRRLLELSLPDREAPLEDWQAVVVGGGIINGLSQTGAWPRQRIEELIGNSPDLPARWERTIQLAQEMADDESVRSGTRYDALRILGADRFERSGELLKKYLAQRADGELQMGAVSALADVDEPPATQALIDQMGNLAENNRKLAFEALLRTTGRTHAFLTAIKDGKLGRDALHDQEIERLRSTRDKSNRALAHELFPKRENP